MDTMPGKQPMENQAPLAGLDPADLLRQGAAEDTLVDGAPVGFVPPPLEEIAAVFPQFEILELIGQGGMGAVYKVRQKDLDRIVALKILPPGIGQSPEFSNRFTREARALAKLNHPGIVTLHEFGQQDGLYFILMEFVDGVNLAQLMKTGRIPPREALAIVPQICDALQYAHDQGIVHRDIKPENILLDRSGRVKVADFGIAKVVAAVCDRRTNEDDDQRRSQTAATLAGKIIGTPQYMAPEQIDHPSEVDHRADIYALGVVFYQMLTGELPGKDLQAPSRKVQIDVRLDEIVLKAMEKNPEMRYQQASVMRTRVDDLQAIIPQNEPSKNGANISNEKENRTEPFAITSFILGIFSLILWPLAALPAIVFGHLARGRIRKNPALKGNGFAIAGLSLGYFFLTISIACVIIMMALKPRSLATRDEYDPQSAYSARAKASPEAMAEPPKLRFIGLQYPSKERWHPDGTPVTDPRELALIREIGPNYVGDMSKGETIRGMDFWFSHPLLESWHITEIEFLDESGVVAKGLGGVDGQRVETFGAEGRLHWSIKTTPADISKPLNVRLNYTLGPLERVQEHIVEPGAMGSFFTDGNTVIASVGETAGGQAFVALAVDEATQSKHRFGVEAVKKDGAIIHHGSWSGGSGPGRPNIITYQFGVPINKVAKFRIGTRPLRSVVWKNVAFSSEKSLGANGEGDARTNPEQTISIMVSGEVRSAGPIRLAAPASLLDVLAAAGGWTGKADLAKIQIKLPGATEAQVHDLDVILKGEAVNPVLTPNSIIEVPQK